MSELTHIETMVFLQGVDLLHYCKIEELLRLAAITRERLFDTETVLFEPSQPATALYFVVRGGVLLQSGAGEPERLGPLNALAALEVLTGRLHTRRARAEAGTLLLALDADDFFDLLANNVEIVKALARQLFRSGAARAEGVS